MLDKSRHILQVDLLLEAKVADLEKANTPQQTVPAIPVPKGNSYSLQKKMGLEDDSVKYDEIRVCSNLNLLPGPHHGSRLFGRG